MKIIFTFVAFVLLMFVISFSFAVRNAIGFEVEPMPPEVRKELQQNSESFMAAKPIECTFNQEIIKEYVKNTGEEPLAKGQSYVTDGTEVYLIEVMLYVNLKQKTFSIFEVYPDGSACLSLQANNLDIFSFGLNT